MWCHSVGKTWPTQHSLSMRCRSREPVCGRLDMTLMLSPLSQRSLRLRSGLLTQREHTVQESGQSNDLCNSWKCMYVTLLELGVWCRRRDLCSVQWLWRLFSEESKREKWGEELWENCTLISVIYATTYITFSIFTWCFSAQSRWILNLYDYFVLL